MRKTKVSRYRPHRIFLRKFAGSALTVNVGRVAHPRHPKSKECQRVVNDQQRNKDDLRQGRPQVTSQKAQHWKRDHTQAINPPLKRASKSQSRYENNGESYKSLTELLTRMRLEGIIPMNCIADETRPTSILTCYQSATNFLGKEVNGFLKGYYRDLMQSQPNHIEIVYEKLTGRSFIEPVALDYCIPLTIGRGFSSLPPRAEMARRYRKSGKDKLIILSMSDLDPDGDEITHSFARSMRDDFGIEVECIKAALTMEQVRNLQLPPNRLKAITKSANSVQEDYCRPSLPRLVLLSSQAP